MSFMCCFLYSLISSPLKPGKVIFQLLSAWRSTSLASRVFDFLCFANEQANVVTDSTKSSAMSIRTSSTSGSSFSLGSICATNSCMLLLVSSRVPVSLTSASVATLLTDCKTVAFCIAGESGFCVIVTGVRAACC